MNTDDLHLSQHTLVLIPCSGSKRLGNRPSQATSIISMLDPELGAMLSKARGLLRAEAQLDETTLMPSYLRYSGFLYNACHASIANAIKSFHHVLIVSGPYGLLLAAEPIGYYQKTFVTSDWPRNLLEDCILDYACRRQIRSVIAGGFAIYDRAHSARTELCRRLRRAADAPFSYEKALALSQNLNGHSSRAPKGIAT